MDQFQERRRGHIEILDRLTAIETRSAERWDTVRREFSDFNARLTSLEQALRGYATTATGGAVTLVVKDLRLLLVAAIVLGTLLGKAGVNPLDWLLG